MYYTRSVATAWRMVGIAQLVERLVVVQEVAGSSPVTHPIHGFSVEVAGSSPVTHPIHGSSVGVAVERPRGSMFRPFEDMP